MSAKSFGGALNDMSDSIGIDGNGSALVTGWTYGGNFGGQQLITGGVGELFLMKVAP
jgi:hypothetical protein